MTFDLYISKTPPRTFSVHTIFINHIATVCGPRPSVKQFSLVTQRALLDRINDLNVRNGLSLLIVGKPLENTFVIVDLKDLAVSPSEDNRDISRGEDIETRKVEEDLFDKKFVSSLLGCHID